MDYESDDHQVDSSEEQGSQQFSETMSSKSSEMSSESGQRSASSAELSHSNSSLSHASSSQKSNSKEDVSIEIEPEKLEKSASKSKSGVKTLSKEDKMLRVFLVIGFFPLPVLGWIIGFFYSLTIKKKSKSQKKMSLALGVLSALAVIAALVVTAYFLLIRNTESAGDKEEPRRTLEGSEYENDGKEQKKVVKEEKKNEDDDALLKKQNLTLSDTESLRGNIEDLTPELKALRAKLFKSVTDVEEAAKVKVEAGLYVPVVLDKFEEPDFKLEKPENQFIPPRILKSPVPVTKNVKEIKFDYFEYVHPSSVNHMLILLRGMDESWKSHELFRFSEYVNHSVMVINVTDAGKKPITKILEELEDVIKTKSKKGMTLVTEIREAEVEEFRKLYQAKTFKRVLAISSHLRCQESNEIYDLPEFVGLFNDKLECDGKSVDFPVMVVKNDLVEYEIMENDVEEIEGNFVELERCKDVLNTKEQTKIYLGKLFGPFRKFATAATASLKEDKLLKEVLCSRKKYI